MKRLDVSSPAEWHALRSKHVGASESAALFDCQAPYALSRFALFQVKSGRIPAPEVDGPRIRAGKILESGIAELVALEYGLKIKRWEGYAESETTPGMGCTPDFEISEHADGHGLLEIKWVDYLQHKKTWTNDEPPMHIQLQLQHQLHVADCAWGAIGALVGDKPMLYRYDYRPKIGAEIEKRIGQFWADIAAGKEPPVDGSDSASAALAAMFPEAVAGKAIDMDGSNEFGVRWADFIQARADRQAAEKAEQANKNWIMSAIGDAEMIRYAGQIIATAKTQTRKSYTVKESSSRVLRVRDL